MSSQEIKPSLIALCLVLVLMGCAKTQKPSMGSLILEQSSDGVALTIPLHGCEGCIRQMIAQAKSHINHPNFLLVLIGDDAKESNYIRKRDFGNGENVPSYSVAQLEKYSPEIQFPMLYVLRNDTIIEQMKIEAPVVLHAQEKITILLGH